MLGGKSTWTAVPLASAVGADGWFSASMQVGVCDIRHDVISVMM